MSLWSALYVGSSGLRTSQNALNTVAHNLTNADTKGYSRQQILQVDQRYVTLSKTQSAISYQQVGLGTVYSRSKQVRDVFMDQAYRRESGRSMFYKVSSEVMDEVESQLGELNGEAFEKNVTDLWTSVQELVKSPASSVTQALFVQRASELMIRAQGIYDGLSAYQDNLNAQIKQQVDKINSYGKKILELNDTIRSIESGQVEAANDYRDTRNRMLDELAELTDITWSEDIMGNVSVRIEGTDFVKGGICFEIGMERDDATGFYTPFWPQNAHYVEKGGVRKYIMEGAKVFDLDREISSDKQTDIGGLKAMLLARGDHRANYTDIENHYDGISQSVVMNIQAEFDQLIHNLTSQINSILETAAGVKQGQLTLEDGTVLENVRYAKSDEGGYMRDQQGAPLQMFVKNVTNGYEKVTATDENGVTAEYWVYMEENPEKTETLYTVMNTKVNQELMQKPSTLGFRLKDGSEDVKTAEALRDLFAQEQYTLNPYVQKRTNLVGYYTDLVSQISTSGYVYRSIYENQLTTVEYTENARDQVMSVSSEEELTAMIRLQNAYNASSRYINAISEMMEHVITSLYG